MFTFPKNQGLVRTVLIVLIAILVLSYFGFDIKGIVESPLAQNNIGYVWGFVVGIWNNYLSQPVTYFWNNIFIGILWESFTGALDNIKNGRQPELNTSGPNVDLTNITPAN